MKSSLTIQTAATALLVLAVAWPANAQVHVQQCNGDSDFMSMGGCNSNLPGPGDEGEIYVRPGGGSGSSSCTDTDGDGECNSSDLDDDNDGIPDANDACPTSAEDPDQCGDDDGCPEADGLPQSLVTPELRACIAGSSAAAVSDALCTASRESITSLVCSDSDLGSLDGIAVAVPNVTLVDFDDNQIVDPSPLADLLQLQEAILSRNEISDDSLLAGLVSRTAGAGNIDLDVSGNALTDIDQLSAAVPAGSAIYLDLRCNGLSHAASGGPGGDPNSDLSELNAVHNAIGTGEGHQRSPKYTPRGDAQDCYLGGAAPGACTIPQMANTSSSNGYCD